MNHLKSTQKPLRYNSLTQKKNSLNQITFQCLKFIKLVFFQSHEGVRFPKNQHIFQLQLMYLD